MSTTPFAKAGILTLVLVITSLITWEFYLRNIGVKPGYDDGESLWSDKRAMVYEPSDRSTVFIGSSRNKFDLDISTWQSLTGDHAIQLAKEGASPLPILNDLAADTHFKGKLIIDVTEGLFFSTSESNLAEPTAFVEYYKKQTPAQRFSFFVNHGLESQFVFLDKDYFSMNAILDNIKIPNRPGIFVFPHFPRDFHPVSFERQNIMTDKFLRDTSLQNQVKANWVFFRKNRKVPPASGATLDSILATVKIACDKIKARGGKILFVRTPSSGPMLAGERIAFSRDIYWGRILSLTGCPGVHFEDYPAIAHFQCPEFSHLKQADAITFTKELIEILEKEKGWSFPYRHVAIK